MKFNFLTVCEIFFKLKFSKFIQNIRTLECFGKFLLIVPPSKNNLARIEAKTFASKARPPHIVRKAGKRFKKSQKFDVMDLIENYMGGPYASSVPCTVHKNGFYSLVWL